ncbi:MAG: type 2b secretion system assembly protein PilB [Idiomarinaceae bacterium HL-53]|nr:MAG: type 2b secretion system assembly protein PilB [Idiomarinaceae bacterium HL-53]CUS47378.1 Type II/IV secretion system protein [Idiomarinaceae bacterium HL-53]
MTQQLLPTELANQVIAAVRQSASDLHLEPQPKGYLLRARCLGELKTLMTVPLEQGQQWLAALKNAAGVDITQRQQAQDGRFQLNQQGCQVDCRFNTLPVLWGEKAVLRLFLTQQEAMTLSALGLLPNQLEQVESALQSKQGLILVTGPTGSGKTATLYSMLASLERERLNICTVEDPVEVPLVGMNQTAVNTAQSRSFAHCLRALLRQDPDVIMVGEIRDVETAEVTLQAAQTGHLVLATLHASHSLAALIRLMQLKCEHSQIASALLLVVNQRLIRVGERRNGVFELVENTPELQQALLMNPNTELFWTRIQEELSFTTCSQEIFP